jgi:hypothetical protein
MLFGSEGGVVCFKPSAGGGPRRGVGYGGVGYGLSDLEAFAHHHLREPYRERAWSG